MASLFSDWSHEIATTVMPAFLATMGVAAAWLGSIEGVSDGLPSFANMASGCCLALVFNSCMAGVLTLHSQGFGRACGKEGSDGIGQDSWQGCFQRLESPSGGECAHNSKSAITESLE
jgi:hypothetical protein